MDEWLWRQIRTLDYLFPSGSAGSNPAGVVLLLLLAMISGRSAAACREVGPARSTHLNLSIELESHRDYVALTRRRSFGLVAHFAKPW